jgi:hypothetical protein
MLAMKWRTGRAGSAGAVAQVALLPVAAFGVHQLRYLLAFGGNAQAVLQETGHSYLNSVVPWIVLLVALAVGAFLRLLGRSLAGQDSVPRYAISLAGLWFACFACLMVIFISQELLEGVFATGHPAGLVGVFGYGGWWSIPAAAMIGLVLATVFHGALWVLREVARRCGGDRPPRRRLVPRPLRPGDASKLRLAPLVAGWSGRGPPV